MVTHAVGIRVGPAEVTSMGCGCMTIIFCVAFLVMLGVLAYYGGLRDVLTA